MSVNSRYAINEKKVQRFGKLYSSIDFDGSDNLTAEQFYTRNDYQVVGEFCIGKQKYPITFKELDRIEETCKEAKSALQRAYQIGLLR
tara:strand:+ start:808 stop:1071 length:264 start_codon:yes stop_codon:yes gene_type:complete